MENTNHILANAAHVWRMHKRREWLFKEAMVHAEERLRRLCSAGYMNPLLCQKDLEHLYDSYKCCLKGEQLNYFAYASDDYQDSYGYSPAAIRQYQSEIASAYKQLFPYLELDPYHTGLLKHHVDKLNEINKKLDSEITHAADSLLDAVA